MAYPSRQILVRKILSCFVLVYYSENFEAGSALTLLKKLRFVFLAAALSCLSSVAFAVPKVILDTDMAYLNDDALAMFVLTQADNAGMLDLLGVTTVGGNVFVPEATTATLRQLELIGRHDIPVYQGTDEPLALLLRACS